MAVRGSSLSTLPLPLTDPERLKRRFLAVAEQRPAVYRMLDIHGRVIYVGKAKRLRARLLSYFRPEEDDDRHSRILGLTDRIEWDYQPSEFAALLGELRQIQRYLPPDPEHQAQSSSPRRLRKGVNRRGSEDFQRREDRDAGTAPVWSCPRFPPARGGGPRAERHAGSA
jgi:hypothetical protein